MVRLCSNTEVPLLQSLAAGLLVAAGTAATLIAGVVHGLVRLLVIACAAVVAGVMTVVKSYKKKSLPVNHRFTSEERTAPLPVPRRFLDPPPGPSRLTGF
jgi:hypothetical protein